MSQLILRRHTTAAALTAAALSMLMVSIAVRAQQPPATPAAKPMVPLAASSLVRNPDAYYGENVSLTAAVEQILSKTAFSVDQDKAKATGKEVLVLAPYLTGTVELNTYVTVYGEVVRFDPEEIARKVKDYALDLPPDIVEKYRGRPAILATGVVNAALIDIAKRLPPPLTPAEEAYDKVMKAVSAANTALRPAVEASNAEAIKQQTAVLKKSFIEAAAFFKARGTADATGWAEEARKHVEDIETAAAAARWDDVKTSAGSLTQMCATCHAAHRERLDDGTFRIRGSR